METEGKIGTSSDEIIYHQCSVCKKHRKTVEADTYCVDCQDYYCKICVDIHKTVPALGNHNIITKDVASGVEALPSFPTSRCGRHRAKIIDMYCQHHDEVGCTTCMNVDHRNCKGVFDIPEFVQTNMKVVPEFLHAMQDVESELKSFLATFQLEQTFLLQNKRAVIDQIQALGTGLENSIRKATENAIQKVEEEFAKLNNDLKVKITSLNDELDMINKSFKVTQSCPCNVPQAFVLSKEEKSCIPAAKRLKDDMTGVELDRRLAFVPYNVYEEIPRNTDVCLGNVTLTPYLYTFSKKGSVDLNTVSAKKSHLFYDSCCTSNGSILFTDTTKNMLIRVCSENMKVVEHINLPSTPYGVCCISDNEIAVCHGKNFKILRINDRIQLSRTVDINKFCFGLSFHNDILYAASEDCVCKYTMDGTLLQSYNKDSDGNNLFSDTQNLVINPLSKHIHIADLDNGVITMDQKGSVVNIVKDIIRSPRGLTVDKFGQVFVSDCTSGNIVQLNCDGKYIQPVIRKGLCAPEALCIDNTLGRMYVAQYNTRDIVVFNAK